MDMNSASSLAAQRRAEFQREADLDRLARQATSGRRGPRRLPRLAWPFSRPQPTLRTTVPGASGTEVLYPRVRFEVDRAE